MGCQENLAENGQTVKQSWLIKNKLVGLMDANNVSNTTGDLRSSHQTNQMLLLHPVESEKESETFTCSASGRIHEQEVKYQSSEKTSSHTPQD